ncbi:hypothetical protein [Oxalobacter paraformigenes]|uniref:hypothetical protein n=1 Tax=Oxalobacter paraformigenes TaxID=556268 RepID=UPI000592EBEF|nr:hypothetical protein [Oxalobacter paraformigenes]
MRPTLYYDARLKSVLVTDNSEKLVVDYQDRELLLPADPVNVRQWEKRLKESGEETGLIGLARLVRRKTSGTPRSRSLYRFDAYPDQTLRRAFDLDDYEYIDSPYNLNCIGWRNAKNPDGFLAPRGLVPGEGGRFVSDNTEPYPVPVPFEFIELATRMKTDPLSILKNFMADACGLKSPAELPRADGFASRSAEAEKRARDYLRQAWRLKKDFF